jgi:pimeloyl-ACP methyl ester carboxylesterase
MARETLVMLPGMMCDQRLFAPQIDAFSASYDVFVPRLSGSSSIDGLASKVLNETGAQCFNLLGLSMGGIVALAMLRMATHRITRLALLDTNHLADAPERFTIRNRQIADAQAGKLKQLMAEEMKPAYLSKMNRHNQSLLGLLIDMATDLGPHVFVEQSQALRDRVDQSDALARYSGPALVLCGAEDSLCPQERHHEISELLPNADLRIIADAGHISTLEQPQAVNQALSQWLARPSEITHYEHANIQH